MIAKKIVLRFPPNLVDHPITYKLIKDHNLEFNILKANVTPREEGVLVLELKGEEEDYKQGIRYLNQSGVDVQPLSKEIIRNETKCTHCGVCVTICPSHALIVEPETRRINFDAAKCIACELCIPACPPRAMEVHY